MNSIELHIIQTLPPSKVNRGEAGEPKTSVMGGVPRGRISSQAQKRSQRDTEAAKRTKVPQELILRHFDKDQAETLRPIVMDLMGLRYGKYDEKGRLKAMVYLSETEVRAYAELVQNQAEELVELHALHLQAEAGGKKKKSESGYADALSSLLSTYQPQVTEQTALFGRFIAEAGDEFVQAATSYSHAITTHRDNTSNDFFSAVDDVEGSSAHIGNVGISAPTLYRFACLDLNLLARHLGKEAIPEVTENWIRGFLFSTPDGGSHGAFARTLPEYVLIVQRQGGHPVTLANAFTEPAYPHDGRTLLQESLRKLGEQAAFNARAFGDNGQISAVEVSLYSVADSGFEVTAAASLEDALKVLGLRK